MIHLICKEYRLEKGSLQSDLGVVKNISAFENGRSSNIKHFEQYLQLAIKLNDLDGFLNKIKGYYND